MYQNTCTMRKVLKWEESVFLNWLRLRAVGTPPPLWMLIIGFLSLSMPISSRGPRRAQAHQMLSHQGSESGGADTSFPCKWSPFTRAQLTSSRPSSGDPYTIDHCQDKMRGWETFPAPQLLKFWGPFSSWQCPSSSHISAPFPLWSGPAGLG